MKNGSSLFKISFFFWETFKFLCYENVPIEDVNNASTGKKIQEYLWKYKKEVIHLMQRLSISIFAIFNFRQQKIHLKQR